MSGEKTPASVHEIEPPAKFRAFAAGEVLRGEFEGQPIVSVYDADSKRGGASRFSQNNLDADFKIWCDVIKREFGAAALLKLQIKFIVSNVDEQVIKQLCLKHSIIPQAVAGVEKAAFLEVVFFTDAGRLRIAPSVRSFRETSAKHNVEKLKQKAKVLIVDDSRTMRALLRKIVNASADLEVVAEAERPSQVEELISKYRPDVMTLDINMPEMSGVQLLKKILNYRFIPTVMISSVNMDEGKEVLNALELGAVDYIHKPAAAELATLTPIIQEKILNAARVTRAHFSEKVERSHAPRSRSARFAPGIMHEGLIAIGASTGGTEAIKQILLNLPAQIPPIVIVQHIPPYFSTAFANRLNDLCDFEVREAQDGDAIKSGRVLIAPGGLHMEVRKEGSRFVARIFDGELVNRFKPSVDVLFNSVAKIVGAKAVGVLLTGMGSDGAKGLLAMKQAGSFTIAQDQESCVVYGMPRAAVELGAATVVESLDDIADDLVSSKAA